MLAAGVPWPVSSKRQRTRAKSTASLVVAQPRIHPGSVGSPLEPGLKLSGHLLSEEIGQGGFSRVFRAEPVGGGPSGAIKFAVKPENVLLGRSGEPKIADLGLSRAHRKKMLAREAELSESIATRDGTKVRGTFDYLAPEVRKGGEITPASDVFALGVMLYELATGKRPAGVFQLPGAMLARQGVAVPKALDRVIERALAHEAAERYPDASVMLADLEAGDAGLAWAPEASKTSRAPEVALVRPLNDYFFVASAY